MTKRSRHNEDGYVRFGKDYKNKRIISVVPDGDEEGAVEYTVEGKHVPVHEGDFVKKVNISGW